MGQFSNAIKAGQTVIELGRNAQGLAGAANEFRTADKGEMGRNVGRAAFNEGADTGKTMGKTWLKTFEVVPRLVCRGLQFLFALIACEKADDKADNGFSPEWILAITVAGAAAVSSVLFVLATPLSAIPFIGSRVKLFKTYRAFAWDLFLFIMWIVVFGIFAGIFLKRSSEDKYKGASTTAMKTAVWVDLVNAILWLISGVYGCIKTFLGDKVDHLSDKAGKKLFEKKKAAPAKDGDTGNLFWHLDYPESACAECDIDTPLEELFSSEMGYSYKAFRQVMLRYEDVEYKFEVLCDGVASRVFIYPDFFALFRTAQENSNVGVVVVSCGIPDGNVVTPEVKAAVVSCLQDHHNFYVYAFRDSEMDLPMLKPADEAIVVVGDERFRSKSMDEALLKAITEDDLRAKQMLMPRTSGIRLYSSLLPVLQLDTQQLVAKFTKTPRYLCVFHAAKKVAANLLMTPTRDAYVAGPSLCAAHHKISRYLPIEFLADALGVEEYPIAHVQGHMTAGHRLLSEESTAIIVLMRGGEPMALGVSEVFARAMLLHAKQAEEIHGKALAGKKTVIMVDSVSTKFP
uniref:Uracil phosphoribosyltransferase n=1 Tax=Colletotrichum fructicola (strain Nara gc5) TaxID=1213859 RepID=L2FRE1_COLFN